jgi:glutathione S-transferase
VQSAAIDFRAWPRFAGEDAVRPLTLIVFPPSIDCELARFMLAHYGIPFREEPHALIFSSFASLRRAFTPVFPVTCGGSIRLTTARAIVDHFDARQPEDARLLPAGRARDVVESDWPAFRTKLGTNVAVFAYGKLLPHPALMARPMAAGAPTYEVCAVARAYPLFAGLLRLLLWITPARVRASIGAVRRAVDAVDARLADGRPYLLGDHFTLSDLAFAAAMGPLVVPDGYGGALPPVDDMPAEMRAIVAEMREHPAGRFVCEVYRTRPTVSSRTQAHPRAAATNRTLTEGALPLAVESVARSS